MLPEFQHLAVGDKIFLGPREQLTVTTFEPNRALVLSIPRVASSGFGSLACIQSM